MFRVRPSSGAAADQPAENPARGATVADRAPQAASYCGMELSSVTPRGSCGGRGEEARSNACAILTPKCPAPRDARWLVRTAPDIGGTHQLRPTVVYRAACDSLGLQAPPVAIRSETLIYSRPLAASAMGKQTSERPLRGAFRSNRTDHAARRHPKPGGPAGSVQ